MRRDSKEERKLAHKEKGREQTQEQKVQGESEARQGECVQRPEAQRCTVVSNRYCHLNVC